MRRYFSLWFSIFKYSLSRDMEYKTNFIGSLFVDGIYYVTWYYFFEVIYSKTTMLGDFDREAILVLNYFYLITRRKFGKFKKLNL